MKSAVKIRETERKYRNLLNERLRVDKRLVLSCPDFKYPEPLYFYVKSAKTDAAIAIRIDGGDETLRFWDYVDDSYEDENGVWARMTEEGFEEFIAKLYDVMDRAVDIEFYDADGLTDDYFAGVTDGGLDEASALATLKKHCRGIKFVFAKARDFYGEKQYVFDAKYNAVKR